MILRMCLTGNKVTNDLRVAVISELTNSSQIRQYLHCKPACAINFKILAQTLPSELPTIVSAIEMPPCFMPEPKIVG